MRVYCNKLPPGSTVVKNLPTPGARDTVHGVAKSPDTTEHTHTHTASAVWLEKEEREQRRFRRSA